MRTIRIFTRIKRVQLQGDLSITRLDNPKKEFNTYEKLTRSFFVARPNSPRIDRESQL